MLRRHIKRKHPPGLFLSELSFWIICLMHDNRFLELFIHPYEILKKAGLEPMQKVLEVGCGPGFFTIPAANIVGKEGMVYAVDVSPLAIERVKKKIEEKGIKNTKLLHANASFTGLPDKSIDLAFMFGLPYIVGGQEGVISEVRRVLKPAGTLACRSTRGSEKKLVDNIQNQGFFLEARWQKILKFRKERE